jgi:hypothetical protein
MICDSWIGGRTWPFRGVRADGHVVVLKQANIFSAAFGPMALGDANRPRKATINYARLATRPRSGYESMIQNILGPRNKYLVLLRIWFHQFVRSI